MAEKYAGSKLYEAVQAVHRTPTTYIERTVTVFPAPTNIISTNPRRLGYVLINHGPLAVNIMFSSGVAVGTGIMLAANGGSISLSYVDDEELVGNEVWGITDGAACPVYILEVVAQ